MNNYNKILQKMLLWQQRLVSKFAILIKHFKIF